MTLKGKAVPQAYGDETYWDTRYSQDVGSFDWYQRYAGMAPLINMYLPKEGNVLMVGCGNAGLFCYSNSFIYSPCKYHVACFYGNWDCSSQGFTLCLDLVFRRLKCCQSNLAIH